MRTPTAIRKATDAPGLLPESHMKEASPSVVDEWLNPATDENGHVTPSSIDIPLSSLSETAGEMAPKTVAARICVRCGAPVPEGHQFCGKCGTRFTGKGSLSEHEADPYESSSSRRMVARMSFVNNKALQTGLGDVQFTLHHVNDDGTLGEQIKLKPGENIIGQQNSPALAADRFVSPMHARIVCNRDRATIEDYGSLNGVFMRISGESVQLSDGDAFRLGGELLCYSSGHSNQNLFARKDDEETEFLGGPEPECWGYLRVILGPFSEGDVYRLNTPDFIIGRKQGNVLFSQDGFVSGTHCKISHNDKGTFLSDLNSSNGTFIKLNETVTVKTETFLLLGNQLLRLNPISK